MTKPTTLPAIGEAISMLGQLWALFKDVKEPKAIAAFAAAMLIFGIWWVVAKVLVTPALFERWPFNWPWWGKIPLPLATRIAFKRLDQTLWVHWAAKPGRTEEQRMDLMAENIADEATIWGRRPPAELEEIGRLAQGIGNIQGGGTRLHMPGNPSPFYEDLHIERWRLWAALRSMRGQTRLRDGGGQ